MEAEASPVKRRRPPGFVRLSLKLPRSLKARVHRVGRARGQGIGELVGEVMAEVLAAEQAVAGVDLLPPRASRSLESLRRVMGARLALDGAYALAELSAETGLEQGDLARWQEEGLLPEQVWGLDVQRLLLTWSMAELDPAGARPGAARWRRGRLEIKDGWHLAVTIPAEVANGLSRRAAERGVSRAVYVSLALLRATGGRVAELSGRIDRSMPRLRLRNPMRWLENGLNLPLRPEGVYLEPELSHFLGRRPGGVDSWVRRGVLRAVRSREGYTFVMGRDVLRLLCGATLGYVEALQVAKLAPVLAAETGKPRAPGPG